MNRDQLSPALMELVQRGFVEQRFFPGEIGRGGEVMRFRVSCEKATVRDYVEQKMLGIHSVSVLWPAAEFR